MNPPPGPFTHRIVHTIGKAKISILKFNRCPKAWLRDEAPEACARISDFRWLKIYGIAPHVGGKLEQDPRFIDAVDVLEAEVAREDAQMRGEGHGQDSE